MEISKYFPAEKRTELEQYRDKIEKLYNMTLKLRSVDLYDYVPDDAKCLLKQNHLLSSKPKTRFFSHYTSNKNVAFAFNYDRNGNPFLINFNSKRVVSDILGIDLFDGFSIDLNSVSFIIDGSGRYENGVVFKIELSFRDNEKQTLKDIYWYDVKLFNCL